MLAPSLITNKYIIMILRPLEISGLAGLGIKSAKSRRLHMSKARYIWVRVLRFFAYDLCLVCEYWPKISFIRHW